MTKTYLKICFEFWSLGFVWDLVLGILDFEDLQ